MIKFDFLQDVLGRGAFAREQNQFARSLRGFRRHGASLRGVCAVFADTVQVCADSAKFAWTLRNLPGLCETCVASAQVAWLLRKLRGFCENFADSAQIDFVSAKAEKT